MKRWLMAAVLLLFVVPDGMCVCSVPRPRLVCAEYFASEAVAEATLIRTRIVRDKNDPEGISAYVYSLRRDRVLRGRVAATFKVYEENSSGRASFDWQIGKKYLLFLLDSPEGKLWELDGCGNSGPSSRAGAVLAQIDAIRKADPKTGVIHGVVLSWQTYVDPVAGVRVEAVGRRGRYRGITNSKGEFQVKVPAGHYTVLATQSGHSFRTSDLSYENARDLRVPGAGCAQVQLGGVERTW